jgi:uncharacterized membrane protein YoaK (UPF0700 family)
MTFVTGVVDAFSYLVLGHVIVVNMTGNILFLGFALVGEHRPWVAASLVALGTFLIGAAMGGKLIAIMKDRRGRLLAVSSLIQAVFLAVAFAVLSATPVQGGYRYARIVALALAMGIQNAASRKLAVPDLMTTVLTLTITGIGADGVLVGGPGSKSGLRLVSVVSTLLAPSSERSWSCPYVASFL